MEQHAVLTPPADPPPPAAEPAPPAAEPAPAAAPGGAWVRDLLEVLLVAVVLYALIWSCIETVRVDGDSMQNTLQSGDFLIASKISYFFGNPARGDIVILNPPHQCDATTADYVKRVVGLPGDNIEIDADTTPTELLVQPGGTGPWDRVAEPYLPDAWEQGPQYPTASTVDAVNQVLHIPAGDYFVMGDNRNEFVRLPLLWAGLAQPHPRQGDPPDLAVRQLRRPGLRAHPGHDVDAHDAPDRVLGGRAGPGGRTAPAPPAHGSRAGPAQPGRTAPDLTPLCEDPAASGRFSRPGSIR